MCQFLEGNTGGLCEVTAANVQLSTVDLTVLMGAGPDTTLDVVRQALLEYTQADLNSDAQHVLFPLGAMWVGQKLL